MSYYIQKKTPASNWYTIHTGVDSPAEFLAEIAFNYDCMKNGTECQNGLEADLQSDIDNPSIGYAVICVCDYTEDGSDGDYIHYRALKEV